MPYLQKLRLPLNGVPYITIIVLISTISATMIIPIFPLYLKQFVSTDSNVGYIFTIIAFLFLFYTFMMKYLLKRFNKLNLLRIGYIGTAITLFLFTILANIKQFLILELFRAFFIIASSITLGLFVREYAKIKSIGKSEGQYFTILNIGFLLGPLFGGLLASAYSFNTVFVISAIPKLLLGILLLVEPLYERTVKTIHEFKILDYLKNKQLMLIYLIQFGLTAWFTLLYNFLPLYASENNFSPELIGYAMVIAAIPLILLELPIGKLADLHGFKRYIMLGFVIMGVLSLITYFANPVFAIWIIVIATFGAAFVEPLTEAYFFEEAKSSEKEFYPVYKTSQGVSSIIFSIIFSSLLFFLNFKQLFIVIGIIMLVFAMITIKLKK